MSDPAESGPVLSPGGALRALMRENRDSTHEVAYRSRSLTAAEVRDVLVGTAEVTLTIATGLERATGLPARTWLQLEANYRRAARARGPA